MSVRAVITVILTLTLAVATASPEGGGPDFEKLFQEALALEAEGKHKEALEKYKLVLEAHPDSDGVLYNAGLAAFQLKEFAVALDYWSRLKKLTPEDWQVRSKLVQAWQALKKLGERDEEIAGLYELRKESGDEALKKRAFYCRDQFDVGNKKIMVFEHFELVGDRAIRWWFGVNDEKGEKEYHLSLGSYDSTHRMMKDMGSLKEGQRGYHLDGYYEWGHATYGFYKGEPDYDETRKRVIAIIEGKVRPTSSSRVDGK